MGPEAIGGIVQRLLEEDVKAAGGSFLDCDGAHLRVSGPAAAVDLVRKRSAEIQRMLDGTVALDVSLLRLPADADAGAAPEALAALVRSGGAQALLGERLVLRRGEVVRRDATDVRSFVATVEGEVASGAAVQSPVTRRLVTGRRLAAQARTLPSGRAAVTIALHVATPSEAMRHVTVSGSTVDLPEVRFASLCAPFVLAKGESGTAVLPDAGGQGRLLLRVTVADAEAPRAGTRTLVDLAAFAGEQPTDGVLTPGPQDAARDAAEDLGRDARRYAVRERYDAAKLVGEELGTWLRLVESEAAAKVEAEFADALRMGRLVRRALVLPSADLTKAAWWDPLTGRATGAAPGAAQDLVLPVRGDTPAVWTSGTWRRVVGSIDVEIAEAAVAVLPEVNAHFTGETVVAGWISGAERIAVDHRTAALLDPAPLAVKTRVELDGKPRTEESPIDGMATAVSRSRADVARRAPAEATLRREGANSVLSLWTAE
jgi:hypothetical protein